MFEVVSFATTYLVGLNGSNLLVGLDVLANLLAELFQSALSDGLGLGRVVSKNKNKTKPENNKATRRRHRPS
jgi:hypothetical protein